MKEQLKHIKTNHSILSTFPQLVNMTSLSSTNNGVSQSPVKSGDTALHRSIVSKSTLHPSSQSSTNMAYYENKLNMAKTRLAENQAFLLAMEQEAVKAEAGSDMSFRPKISQKSKDIHREDRIEDFLLSKGKEYAENRYAQTHAEDEAVTKSGKPRVTAMADSLHREGDVADRLYTLRTKYDIKQSKQECEVAAERQDAEFRALRSPELNQSRRSYGNRAEERQKWERQKEDKIALARLAIDATQESIHHPTINEKSRDILNKSTSIYGRMSGLPLAEALVMKSEFSKLRAVEDQVIREMNTITGTPLITNMAANLNRPGDVGSRLHGMASLYEQKRQELREKLQKEEEDTLHATRSRLSASGMRRPASAGGPLDIYERDMDERMKRDEDLRMIMNEERAINYHPQLNPRSLQIAESLPESAVERLLKPKDSTYLFNESKGLPGDPSQYTFHPEISRASIAMDARKGNLEGFERSQALYEHGAQEIRAKRDAVRRRVEELEMEPCTFKPNITATTLEILHSHAAWGAPVVDRTYAWLQKRSEKIRREADEMRMKELSECTFHPEITHLPDDAVYASKDSEGRTTDDAVNEMKKSCYGFMDHMNRQEAARKAKESNEDASVFVTGKNWSGVPTQVKAFSFQHHVDVRSLKKHGLPLGVSRALLDGELEFDDVLSQSIRHENNNNRHATSDNNNNTSSYKTVNNGNWNSEEILQNEAGTTRRLPTVRFDNMTTNEWSRRRREKHELEDMGCEYLLLDDTGHYLPAFVDREGARSDLLASPHAMTSSVGGVATALSFNSSNSVLLSSRSEGGSGGGRSPRVSNMGTHSASSSDLKKKGELNYYNRMERSRRKQSEQETRVEQSFATGDRWTPQRTQPKEFRFNKRNSIKIASLGRPVYLC